MVSRGICTATIRQMSPRGTLLTGVDYDTVPVNALTSKVKWYNAAFGANGTDIQKNTAKTAFVPITLTLNQDFLTNNSYADSENSQKDISSTPSPIRRRAYRWLR